MKIDLINFSSNNSRNY